MRKLILALPFLLAACLPAYAAPHALDGYCEAVDPGLAELQDQAKADGITVTELSDKLRANVEANLRELGMDVPDLVHVYVMTSDDAMVLAIVAADGCVVHMGKIDATSLAKLTALPGLPS